MGSGGPTSVSTGTFEDLEKRIIQRLGELAKGASRIMFACEAVDLPSLTSKLTQAGFANNSKTFLVVGPDPAPFLADISSIQLLVTYTDKAAETPFLNALIDAALAATKQGIHARAHSSSSVPTKIRAYRWRAMAWEELLALLK